MANIAIKSIKSKTSATNCKILRRGFDIKNQIAIRSCIGNKLVLKKGYYLSDALNTLPSGIIDKRVTGIGATSLEITSHRNSIIVMPTKVLADQKATKGTLYVGSVIPGKRRSVSLDDIRVYHQTQIGFRKIIVVADSLWRVIDAIGSEIYSEYFLMIDEIDSYQSEIIYRKQMENCIDYYHRFDSKCLISATTRSFSDPRLKSESKYFIDKEDRKDIELSVIVALDALKAAQLLISNCLKNAKGHKILVAVNSVQMALQTTKILTKDLDCWILCSEKSRDKYSLEIQDFNGEIIDGRLPGDINFITSSYFTGIDILEPEPIIVIMISDYQRPNTLLSIEKMKQILGRSRKGVRKAFLISNPGGTSSIFGYTHDIGNATDVIHRFQNLVQGTSMPEQCVLEMRNTIIKSDLPIRCDINDQLCISYLQIDYAQQQQDIIQLHSAKGSLRKKVMMASGFKIKYWEVHKSLTPAEKSILQKSSSKRQIRYRSSFKAYMDNVKFGQNGTIDDEFTALLHKIYTQIWNLTHDTELTCYLMKNHFSKSYSKRKLYRVLVSLRFRGLESRIKSKIIDKFIRNEKYTTKEIYHQLMDTEVLKILERIGATIPTKNKSVTAVQHFVTLRRSTRREASGPKSCYLVVDHDPLKIRKP